LRIIAGTAKGRKLFPPRDRTIRPTSDRAREAVFNILDKEVVGAKVLDLFAGTGALGLEALSRGARQAVFIDLAKAAVTLIKKNVLLCGFSEQSLIIQRDLRKGLFFLQEFVAGEPFNLIFLDPPYGQGLGLEILNNIGRMQLLAANGQVVVEEETWAALPQRAGGLVLSDHRCYGEAGIWFYTWNKEKNNDCQ